MKDQLISINAACNITGYSRGYIFGALGSGRFPAPVKRGVNGVLMFSLDDVCEWNEINRQSLISGYTVAYLLNISINELIALDEKCAGFPLPVERNRNISLSKWLNGEILDWRADYWRSV